MTTYTSNLRLILMDPGSSINTWGTINNASVISLVDQAIAGYMSIAMSDANYTLTASQGASDQSRNAILNFTGTLTATRYVELPASTTKWYIVSNNTNYPLTFQVTGSGGATYTLANGSTGIIYTDATNVFLATGSYLPLTGGTLTGNLFGTNAGFGSGSITSGSATLAAQSAVFTDSQVTSGVGQYRIFSMLSNGLYRWNVITNTDLETGSNAGSNFTITRYTDAGTFIDNPIAINRATGVVTIQDGLIINTGGLQVTGGFSANSGLQSIVSGSTTNGLLAFGSGGNSVLDSATASTLTINRAAFGSVASQGTWTHSSAMNIFGGLVVGGGTGLVMTGNTGVQSNVTNGDTYIAGGNTYTSGAAITFNGPGAGGAMNLYTGSGGTNALAVTINANQTTNFNADTYFNSSYGPTSTLSIGYRGIPQSGGAFKGSNYTAVLSDAGGSIMANASVTLTIPANASVAYPIGTTLTFLNYQTSGNVTIAINSDTMYLANTAGTTGSRTLAPLGVATAIKVLATYWVISGAGLT